MHIITSDNICLLDYAACTIYVIGIHQQCFSERDKRIELDAYLIATFTFRF